MYFQQLLGFFFINHWHVSVFVQNNYMRHIVLTNTSGIYDQIHFDSVLVILLTYCFLIQRESQI